RDQVGSRGGGGSARRLWLGPADGPAASPFRQPDARRARPHPPLPPPPLLPRPLRCLTVRARRQGSNLPPPSGERGGGGESNARIVSGVARDARASPRGRGRGELSMIGILSAGGHVPRYRLTAKTLGAVWGAGGTGERAVANYDEDSLTMAVEASLNAPHGRHAPSHRAWLPAPTSPP